MFLPESTEGVEAGQTTAMVQDMDDNETASTTYGDPEEDDYAHTAAIKTNGYTVAVLGSGVDICYPREHMDLYEAMIETGCIVSEYPPGTPPMRYSFPRRNRLIAALSDEICVIGAGRNSGTRTTIEACERYGKPFVIRSSGE